MPFDQLLQSVWRKSWPTHTGATAVLVDCEAIQNRVGNVVEDAHESPSGKCTQNSRTTCHELRARHVHGGRGVREPRQVRQQEVSYKSARYRHQAHAGESEDPRGAVQYRHGPQVLRQLQIGLLGRGPEVRRFYRDAHIRILADVLDKLLKTSEATSADQHGTIVAPVILRAVEPLYHREGHPEEAEEGDQERAQRQGPQVVLQPHLQAPQHRRQRHRPLHAPLVRHEVP
mmetsp:Transcript_82049/g.250737  ORF Transcript_82049/g.250737 Transcript_82049/m.250737 type:complete len:230 (+) Transcript_82049:207-896(+)